MIVLRRKMHMINTFCSSEAVFDKILKHDWNILQTFLRTLIEVEQIKSEEKTAKEEREVDALKYIMSAGKEYWKKVFSWGASRNLLSEMEASILKLVINIEKTGRIPSVKQAKVVIKARERLISDGMPMQF